MENRRTFITKLGKGAILSSAAVRGLTALAAPGTAGTVSQKAVRIGIIGAENSHTRGYGKLFNLDRKFPGVEVLYVWGETEAFAKDAMERGGIPNMVKDPAEMLGKIDALIVDHRHAKYHLEAALPFVKAGIPAFIDKPFCYRVEEGKKFLEERGKKVDEIKDHMRSWSGGHRNELRDIASELRDIASTIRRRARRLDAGKLSRIKEIVIQASKDIDSVLRE